MNTAVWAQECVAQFFAEIYALGLRHVVFCPGSRSTPLALVAARHGGFKLWQHIDERSAGYFGLGIAKWDRQPVVLVCTSGTAVANFAPAVVEAYTAGVPLLVCTADRPPELHGTGANQTIEQSGFFGKHVKLSIDLSVPDGSVEVRRSFRSTAQRAVAAAMNAVQGPVHLNFPFREPLVAPPMALPDQLDRAAGSIVTVAPLSIDSTALEPLASILRRADRGVIIVGEQHDPALASALMALARRLQFPVLADALSNLRNGPHYGPLLIDSYEALLRDPACTALLGPDVVVRCGAAPTAKSLLQLLEQARCPQIVLAEERWADPAATTTTIIRGRPAAICTALTGLLEGQQLSAKSSQWLQRWQSWQHTARRALTQETRCFADLFEGRVFVELNELMPEGGVIFAGNSMPVRDLDAFFGGSHRTVHLLANRGASGIDGVTSTALGVAAASGRPAVLVIGDLSFFH
ncbi:MAG: 2-succinyl-5-enolpyruvyl-6-hydroxy-3-cyclohexene-1-carboxylic-acid synthase, partial [Chloroflexi bacterium]|nr:2-succinyl-5-enolpyruvyl-6-hydroxy-3-cyclohexene-1-carboxylic-acid synthase [Chloroflexota bacterium]